MRRLLAIAALLAGLTSALADGPGGRLCAREHLQSVFPAGAKFKATVNGIVSPTGQKIALRGVAMFDYLFISFEFRGWNGSVPTNQIYRTFFSPGGKGPGTGVSEPTYGARSIYVSHAYVAAQLQAAYDKGINMIRVVVEPAVRYASVSYVDPVDGKTYPSDPAMLDDIVNTATGLGMIVDLSMGQDPAHWDPTSPVLSFLPWLAARYGANPLVWIDTGNEFSGMAWLTNGSGGATPNPHNRNISTWLSFETNYIAAIRGQGFTAPIILDDPNYASKIAAIWSSISTTAPFTTDGNLLYGIHAYTGVIGGSGSTLSVESDWVKQSLPNYFQTNVFAYLGYVPMFLEELGSSCANCGAPIYDPGLGTSLSLSAWRQMQLWDQSVLDWSIANSGPNGQLGGALVRSWFEYTGSNPDPSALFLKGDPSAWEKIAEQHLWRFGKDGCRRRHMLHGNARTAA